MDYNKQAEDFLKECGVLMFAEKAVPQHAPLWAENGKHGTCWSVTLVKLKNKYTDSQYAPTTRREIMGNVECERSFFFWSSIASKEQASRSMSGVEKKPKAYDVLSGIATDVSGGFEDFCANYGYDTDSKKAEKTFDACKELNEKLAVIFTITELEKLAEIQ